MVYFFLVLLGLVLGSFTNALVWRLRESSEIRFNNKKISKAQSKKLHDLSILKGRSMCVDCSHQLAWYDLIPVFSWLYLKGKCRYCKKSISWQYPTVEVAVGAFFALSYYLWPYELGSTANFVTFGLWLMLAVALTALVIYDIRWMELPTELVYTSLGLSFLFVAIESYIQADISMIVSSIIGSVALGGLFCLIYQISNGDWIGGGDVRLGFAMGMFLGWQKSLLGLSLAAYLGTVIVIVAVLMGKYHKRMKLPFGPLLIAGWTISLLFGQQMIDWYLRLIGVA